MSDSQKDETYFDVVIELLFVVCILGSRETA